MTLSTAQSMLLFAYGADTQLTTLSGNSATDEATLQAALTGNVLPAINDQTGANWQLVWGPYVKTEPYVKWSNFFPHLQYRILNVMYVAQNGSDYVIGIAGTDFRSVDDWLFEDLDVLVTREWHHVYSGTAAPTSAKVSQAMVTSMNILEAATPSANIPGSGTTILDFLDDAGADNGTLYVTGHSLGGALSAVLALWVADQQKQEKKWGGLTVAPYCLAGPSPGNAEFANYYASLLPNLQRIWNEDDIVPNAWNSTQMTNILAAYQASPAPPDGTQTTAFEAAIKLTSRYGYVQPLADTPPLPNGNFNASLTNFVCQLFWQHIFAYVYLLGLTPDASLTMPASCPQPPLPPNPPSS